MEFADGEVIKDSWCLRWTLCQLCFRTEGISICYHSDVLNKNPGHASTQHNSHETDCISYWEQHGLLHSTIAQGLLEVRVQKVSIFWCGNSCIWINYDQLWHTVYSQLSFVMPQVSDTHCWQSCGGVSDSRLLVPVKEVSAWAGTITGLPLWPVLQWHNWREAPPLRYVLHLILWDKF